MRGSRYFCTEHIDFFRKQGYAKQISNPSETTSKPTVQTSVFITEPGIIYPHTWLKEEIPSNVAIKRNCRKKDMSFLVVFGGAAHNSVSCPLGQLHLEKKHWHKGYNFRCYACKHKGVNSIWAVSTRQIMQKLDEEGKGPGKDRGSTREGTKVVMLGTLAWEG